MKAIWEINPRAKLIFTEDLTKIHGTKELKDQINLENSRRWLSIDLACGMVIPGHSMWNHLLDQGISEKKLHFFIQTPLLQTCWASTIM